jgi:hypothetical protein
VRFNERIRIAGSLISDEALATVLAEVLDQAEDIHPTFFEATTAAALLAFAREPADAHVPVFHQLPGAPLRGTPARSLPAARAIRTVR